MVGKIFFAMIVIPALYFVIRCNIAYNKERENMTPEERAKDDADARLFMNQW